MNQPGGAIRIVLTVADGRVRATQITGREVSHVSRVLVGMPVEELPEWVGRVFSLCGRAQTGAALQAVEDATGMIAPAGTQAARDVLRLAEMLVQTTMRLALHWPKVLGLPTRPEIVRSCLAAERQLEDALFDDTAWRVPGSGVRGRGGPARAVTAQMAGSVAEFAPQTGLPEAVHAAGLSRIGILPDGISPEFGALTRQWDAPAVAAAREEFGPGLAARLAASLADLEGLPQQIHDALDRVEPASAAPIPATSGTGVAEVETARGPLRHTATVKDGKIAAYSIEAPTEANFRAGGPVDQGLIGLPQAGLEQAAHLHVLAVDPCVEFTVEVRHA